ncbi:MAG: T9SS type A sorting domain-containing protein [Chitinophagales bacterium]|nr:T9SS type A sorting domain-containing protein [Chitinophagales bacterium]
MKLFCSLLLILYTGSVNLLKADDLQPKITPEELGYTGKASITYFEKIDDDYLGMVVIYEKDGHGYMADWVYHLKTKEARNTTYNNERGQYSIQENEYYTNISQHGLRYFLREENWIYTIVSGYSNDDIGNYSTFLLGTHLRTGQQNARLLHEDCLGFMGFLQSAGKNFLIETEGCGKAFNLLTFDDSTWTEVWSIQDFGWESFDNYETQRPFYHKEKIYLSAQDMLYVFNTANFKVDTIIGDTRDVGGVPDECTSEETEYQCNSVPTQYFAYGDNVYIVYNNIVRFAHVYLDHYALRAIGNTRIWKTNGTKNGTSIVQSIPPKENGYGILTSFKLFELDGRLLWLSDVDTTTAQLDIYEIKGEIFENLGKINFTEGNMGVFYNKPFRSSIPLFNYISPIRFEHQDILTFVEILFDNASNTSSHYLNVVGIEGNQVKQYLKNYPLNSTDNQWSYNEYMCWNVEDKLTVFRHRGRDSDTTDTGLFYTSYLDFLISDSYKDISFETYSPMTEGAYGRLSIVNVGDEVLFGASDKEAKNFIIWSWKDGTITQVKNYLSNEQLDWTIFPNPTSHTLSIRSTENLSGHLSIIGSDGRVHQAMKMDGFQKQIDISQLPTGMYLAVYQDGMYVSNRKFVIKK